MAFFASAIDTLKPEAMTRQRKVNVTFLPRMRMVLLPVNRFLMGIIRSIRLQARKAKPLSRTLRYSFPLMERLTAIS